MILPSAEVRWFFRGNLPDVVSSWFCAGDRWLRQPERIDEYLVLPGCRTTGIKLREGLFEVKARVESPTPADYPSGVRGFRDSWVKWSRPLAEEAGGREILATEEERWVKVHKARTLRAFSLDGIAQDDAPRPVDVSARRPRRGCGVEVTAVSLEGDLWWTLGLEAFDAGGSPGGALERVACFFFATAPPPLSLERAASYSYVAWLARRARR